MMINDNSVFGFFQLFTIHILLHFCSPEVSKIIPLIVKNAFRENISTVKA